jgi:hypothetical protein
MTAIGRAVRGLPMLVALSAAAGCRRAEAPVATLLQVEGRVERSAGADWTPAAAGAGFALDDVLRTGPRSSARLAVANGSIIRVEENGRLRFRRATPGAQRGVDLGIELGSAEIERAAGDLRVLTPLGPTRVPSGSRLRVHAGGEGTTLEVLVGRAVVDDPGGELVLAAGDGLRIGIGAASRERYQVSVGAAVVDSTPAPPPPPPSLTPPPDAGTGSAPPPEPTGGGQVPAPAMRAGMPSPSHARADVTIRAGERAVLHDARPALTVRLRFEGLCPADATVEVGGARRPLRLLGAGAVVLRLRPGSRRYRLRCAGDPPRSAPRAAGVLTFKRDSGNVPLPRRPPDNTIDADGRRYTVLFQTRPPAFTLTWPAAPAGVHDLALHLESPEGARTLRAPSPRHPLPSGTLPEGTYTWWFSTQDGLESPRTTVTIGFDNAAPTAQFFRAPVLPPGSPARAIPIDGVTIAGAQVSAAGQALAVDARGRFRGAMAPLEGDDAVAVRLEHPRSGVHYYIRRPSSTVR